MTTPHWFWFALTTGCIVWYATITVYVAIRGAWDIRHMLAQLGRLRTRQDDDSPGE